jgi:hypothetical protein
MLVHTYVGFQRSDPQVAVHTAAWNAFDSFVKSVPKDATSHSPLSNHRCTGQHSSGLGPSQGVSPTVPIIIAGLTTGSNDQREQAAYDIGDLVECMSEVAIKPFVVPFTEPLIRVAKMYRFP